MFFCIWLINMHFLEQILGEKFKEASKNLKRGIIFAASLYVWKKDVI